MPTKKPIDPTSTFAEAGSGLGAGYRGPGGTWRAIVCDEHGEPRIGKGSTLLEALLDAAARRGDDA